MVMVKKRKKPLTTIFCFPSLLLNRSFRHHSHPLLSKSSSSFKSVCPYWASVFFHSAPIRRQHMRLPWETALPLCLLSDCFAFFFCLAAPSPSTWISLNFFRKPLVSLLWLLFQAGHFHQLDGAGLVTLATKKREEEFVPVTCRSRVVRHVVQNFNNQDRKIHLSEMINWTSGCYGRVYNGIKNPGATLIGWNTVQQHYMTHTQQSIT